MENQDKHMDDIYLQPTNEPTSSYPSTIDIA